MIKELDEFEGEEKIEETTEKVELALHLVLGFSSPGTIKLKGEIGDREMVVLIDCGATHNFIHRQLVEELKLPVTNTTKYGIGIGDRTMLQRKVVCK